MKRKLVVSLITEEQEFQVLQAADARETAARLGLEVEVVFAENNSVRQVQQLFRFVHSPEPPAAIVVETVSGEGLERVARNAVRAGIAWVLLNRRVPYLDGLRGSRPDLPVMVISTDQEEVGRIQGRQVRTLLPGGGSLLYLQGPADTSVAQERRRSFERELGGRGVEIEVLSGDWTERSGERICSAWLRSTVGSADQLDLVVAQNDSMAVGARRAFQAAQREMTGLSFIGCDGLPAGGLKLTDRGELAATVITPSNSGPALVHISSWLRTGRVPSGEILLEPFSYPAEGQIRPSSRDRTAAASMRLLKTR